MNHVLTICQHFIDRGGIVQIAQGGKILSTSPALKANNLNNYNNNHTLHFINSYSYNNLVPTICLYVYKMVIDSNF